FSIVLEDDRIFRITLPPGVVGPEGPKGDTGARGERGDMGSPGADGRDGMDGLNGNDGNDGAGVTFAQVLKDGSLAMMLSTGEVLNAGKVVGPPGPQGAPGRAGVPGPAGENGRTIHSFTGPPDGAVGEEGDYAIDHSAWRIYGPKSGVGWGGGQDLLAGRQNLDQATRSFNGRSGPGGGRFFGMGAPSLGVGVGGGGASSALKPINGHDAPLPAGAPFVIASDPDGDAMHVLVKADTATGSWYGEVVVTHHNAVVDHTVAWEVPIGAPPNLTFSGAWVTDHLELSVVSDVRVDKLRGRILYV
ncbi:MAG: hypothetical protein ACO29V_15260, partial [Limnohabitans sp.]